MSAHAPKHRPTRSRRLTGRKAIAGGVIALALGGAACAVVGIGGSGAWFTGSAAGHINSFTAGTVGLSVDNGNSGQSIPLTVTGLMPGDSHYEAIRVQNTGTMDLRYAIKQATEGGSDANLTSALTIDTRTVSDATKCTDTDHSAFAAGSPVANAATTWSASGTNYVGDITALTSGAADVGSRTIAASGNEILCLQVTLPSTNSDTSIEGKSTSVDMDFEAIQTKNIG